MLKDGWLYKPGNAGPFVTTAGNDLLHTLGRSGGVAAATLRKAKITKINAYNNTGGNVTLQFGTLDRTPAGALFVALLPIYLTINGIDNEWLEPEIVAAIWENNRTANALLGRTGDIYVLAGAAAVVVSIEVAERGI